MDIPIPNRSKKRASRIKDIYNYLKKYPEFNFTSKELSLIFCVSQSTIKKDMKDLINIGFVDSLKSGYSVVKLVIGKNEEKLLLRKISLHSIIHSSHSFFRSRSKKQ